MIIQPEQFLTSSLRNSSIGNDVTKILAAAISSVDAGVAVRNHLYRDQEKVKIGNLSFDLRKFQRVYIIGVGKAALPMVEAVIDILGDRITHGVVITTGDGLAFQGNLISHKVRILPADHPIPSQRNIEAGKVLSTLVSGLQADDLVIFLLSGGGSALLLDPGAGVSLDDIQNITTLLLKCGAPIGEINTLRKHLDNFKGGGLAQRLYPATIVSLILSDVISDDLSVIASGPTTSDPTTYRDAWNVITKYGLVDKAPASIINRISSGLAGVVPETIKPDDPVLKKVFNILIGNIEIAVDNAIDEATHLGYDAILLTTSLQGEASQMGSDIVSKVKSILATKDKPTRPTCWIAGGETTVTISGPGTGGRNQELALGAVSSLSSAEKMLLVSLATDGRDGPTDAAGAVATHETFSRGIELGMNPQDYLARNDSYHYFEAINDLIKIGPTMTNVNDLLVMVSY